MIIDSQPLTVALLASVLFGERLGALGFLGLGLGVVGLCLLEVPVEALQGKLRMQIRLSGQRQVYTYAVAFHTSPPSCGPPRHRIQGTMSTLHAGAAIRSM